MDIARPSSRLARFALPGLLALATAMPLAASDARAQGFSTGSTNSRPERGTALPPPDLANPPDFTKPPPQMEPPAASQGQATPQQAPVAPAPRQGEAVRK